MNMATRIWCPFSLVEFDILPSHFLKYFMSNVKQNMLDVKNNHTFQLRKLACFIIDQCLVVAASGIMKQGDLWSPSRR